MYSEFLQFGPGAVGQPAAGAGEASQGGIVENDGNAVAGDLDVEFDAVDAERKRAGKGEEGVLGRLG